MRRAPDAAEMLRLRRELEEARERMRVALEHRDRMPRELDAVAQRLTKQLDQNNFIWNAAAKVRGGLEALRSARPPIEDRSKWTA